MCFFQAEDGIRDIGVTGVQTCALPILGRAGRDHLHVRHRRRRGRPGASEEGRRRQGCKDRGRRERRTAVRRGGPWSEERRVGEEGRTRWAPHPLKKKTNSERKERSLDT